MIALVLMVRNEERVLQRCIESASPVVDRVVVIDTGSTDGTVALAKSLGAIVCVEPWQDFGKSRSRSFHLAREAAPECEWLLLLDADMRLVCGDPRRLREHLERSSGGTAGYLVTQCNGGIDYNNIRFIRSSMAWRCIGVTHEYWACETPETSTLELNPSLVKIDDVGDGGCKDDKFQRDERLLRQGLVEEPSNERYFFYLACTLMNLGKRVDAAHWFERRFYAGGWFEERYYSAFMLVGLHEELALQELWAERAICMDPERNESRLAICHSLREAGKMFKAWHYALDLRGKPSGARLFLERSSYDPSRISYERSLIHFYVSPNRREGMQHCLRAVPYHARCVLYNMRFYAEPVAVGVATRVVFEGVPEGFHAGSVSVDSDGTACVRTADYWIAEDGSYVWRNGIVSTRNFLCDYDFSSGAFGALQRELIPDGREAGFPRREQAAIRGLEDVRVLGGRFTATMMEWAEEGASHSMAWGHFPEMRFTTLRSPAQRDCEKNWLPLPDGRLIYSWLPFTVGKPSAESGSLKQLMEWREALPEWWSLLRGSATPWLLPAEADGRRRCLCLTHLVDHEKARSYYSVLVELAPEEHWRPVAWSLPFYLLHRGVEYCLSAQSLGEETHLFVSRLDRETWVLRLPTADLLARLTERGNKESG